MITIKTAQPTTHDVYIASPFDVYLLLLPFFFIQGLPSVVVVVVGCDLSIWRGCSRVDQSLAVVKCFSERRGAIPSAHPSLPQFNRQIHLGSTGSRTETAGQFTDQLSLRPIINAINKHDGHFHLK